MNRISFFNGTIVTAQGPMSSASIAFEDEHILVIEPAKDDAVTVDLAGGWLLPGFVDTQVNGGGGVLLNNDISIAAIRTIAAAHAQYGTTALLPTLISEKPAQIAQALDMIDAAIDAGVPGIIGIHIEGPFLNPARKGIHEASNFQTIDAAMLALLTRARRGVVVVTLAPENIDPDIISALVAAGVRVSAGHSEADYDTMIKAFNAGLSGITHLFNAMPPLHHRMPGLVGAALDDPRPWCGLIVDRAHVDPAVLRIALRARPFDRMMLVTDAMSSVGAIEKDFVLQGKQIRVADGICQFKDGTLAGSDLDMATAIANSVQYVGISVPEAAAMASTHPAAFLGLERERGALAPTLRADWVWLSPDFKPVATWIGGVGIQKERMI